MPPQLLVGDCSLLSVVQVLWTLDGILPRDIDDGYRAGVVRSEPLSRRGKGGVYRQSHEQPTRHRWPYL